MPVLLFDLVKGLAPALLGATLASPLVGVLAGAAAMLGHWRPLFLGFARGGKTVATAAGVLGALAPFVALVGVAIWAVVFVATRYVSVASMTTALALPPIAWLMGRPWPVVAFTVAAAVAVVLLHRPNIARLRAGNENRATLRRRGRGRAAARVEG